MNYSAKVIAILALTVMTGCAGLDITPPTERKIDSSRVYDMPYEQAWTKAVDWFAGSNVKIEKIEKSSGLLTAKYSLASPEKYLDCRQIKVLRSTAGERSVRIDRRSDLNVTVRAVDENRTRINVNFFGDFTLSTNALWEGPPVNTAGRCVSTGLLEYSILNSIY